MARRHKTALQPPTMFGGDPAPQPPDPSPLPTPRVSGPPAAVPLPDAPNPATPRPDVATPPSVDAMIAAAIANGTHAPPDLTPPTDDAPPPELPASTLVVVARQVIRSGNARPDPRADWTLADVLILWAQKHSPDAYRAAAEDPPGDPWWFGKCCAAIFRERALIDWRFAVWAAQRWPADVVKLARLIGIVGLDARWVESVGLVEGVEPLAVSGAAGRIELHTRKAAA